MQYRTWTTVHGDWGEGSIPHQTGTGVDGAIVDKLPASVGITDYPPIWHSETPSEIGPHGVVNRGIADPARGTP